MIWITPTGSFVEANALGAPALSHSGVRAPAIAWESEMEFGPWAASSDLDASLRLAAQEDYGFRAAGGLRAQRLVGDDQRGSWRHPTNAIQCLLWNDTAVERRLSCARVLQHRPNVAVMAPARSNHAACGRPSNETALRRTLVSPVNCSSAVRTCMPMGRSGSMIVTGLSRMGSKPCRT